MGPTQINDKPVAHLGISVLNHKDIFRIRDRNFRWEYPDSRIPNSECDEQHPDCLSVSTQKASIENKCFFDDKKVPKNLNKCVILSIHEGKKRFQCNICDSKYTSRQGLLYHIKIVHDKIGKKFKCNICGDTFYLQMDEIHRRALISWERAYCSIADCRKIRKVA